MTACRAPNLCAVVYAYLTLLFLYTCHFVISYTSVDSLLSLSRTPFLIAISNRTFFTNPSHRRIFLRRLQDFIHGLYAYRYITYRFLVFLLGLFLLLRPHRMHGVHLCGLLLLSSRGMSVCLCVCVSLCLFVCLSVGHKNYKKLSYRRGTARCVVSIEILPIATQQCRNYLYDKS